MGKAALALAERGWAVMPLHTPVDGRCDCFKQCTSPGKHPRTKNGFKDATDDVAIVTRMWEAFPDANIGVVPAMSQLVVMDVDPRNNGDETFRDLQDEHGDEWVETVTALTGGGGTHLYFRAPRTAPVPTSHGEAGLGEGIDVIGDSGYVVAPPSLHISGNRYTWETGYEPGETPLIRFPSVFVRERRSSRAADVLPDTIPQGEREKRLMSLLGSMRRQGANEDEMLGALVVANERCRPPLSRRDLERMAHSVAQYAPSRDIPVSFGEGITTGYRNLRRIDTIPPTFLLEVNGHDVRLSADELAGHGKVRVAAVSQTNQLPSAMKAAEWDEIVQPLLEKVQVIEVPEDASEDGLAWIFIREYLDGATDSEEQFVHGKPLLGEGVVYVAARYVRNALQQRGIVLKQTEIWRIVAAHGGERRNVRIEKKQTYVWAIPVVEEEAE